MKNPGSPRTAQKLSTRTRLIIAITTVSLLLLLLGVPAFMQSLQKGDIPDTAPAERVSPKNVKAPKGARPDFEAAEQRDAAQGVVTEPSVISATSNYTFSTATNATLTDMSTGTITLVAADNDDTASSVVLSPMDFYFQGVRYNSFSANSNGLIRLGGTAVQGGSPYKPLAQAGIPLLTPYGADQRTLATTGKVHTKIVGTAPNRVLVVEWLNMQSNFSSGGTSDLTYQARLYETTGVIEYVYGKANMSTAGAADANSRDPNIGFSSSNTAGTVGSVTAPQSGTPAPTYDGSSATAVANTYTAGTIPVLNTTTEGSRRIFTFTPPVPTAPTNLTFTGVTSSAMTLNWTDSANETIYAIYNSTDGTNYSFVNTAAQNATSFSATGLNPSTTYFWQVYAVSEGALSTALSGSQATTAAATITSTPVGGNWSATTTWVGGVVPTAGDNVVIADLSTVTIDVTTAACLNLTVGQGISGTLQYITTPASTLTVNGSVTVASGGTFNAGTGTLTTHVLNIGGNTSASTAAGNLTVNGTFDMNTTAGVTTNFFGSTNGTVSGSGATCDFFAIVMNKGTSITPVLDVTRVITMNAPAASASRLSATNGTFKLSSASALTPWFGSQTLTATTGRLWINNASASVNCVGVGTSTGAGSPTINGTLQVDHGTFGYGSGNNTLTIGAAGTLTIGGADATVNMFGAVVFTASGATFNMTAGNFNVDQQAANALGSTVNTVRFNTGNVVNFTGGTLTIVDPHSAASTTGKELSISASSASTFNFNGGTISFGDGVSTTAGSTDGFEFDTFVGVALVPLGNIVVNNTATNAATRFVKVNTALSPFQTTFNGNLTVTNTGGSEFRLNGNLVAIGGNVINNGVIDGSVASSRLYFAGSSAQTYSGTGTAGTVALPLQSVDMDSAGLTIQASTTNNLITSRVNMFRGNVTNSNKITLGVGGTSTGVIQMGVAGATQPTGSFDVAPTFNLGSGGQILIYAQETAARTTGVEINPTRTLTSMTVANTNNLIIAGGDLSLSSTAAALTLTDGTVTTNANILALTSGTATVTRTNGYIIGNLRKNITATGSKTFEVGTTNGYSPLAANVTAGTGNMTVKATQGKAPYVSGTNALARYWTLTGTGLTANLTFTYLASDVTGTVANYQFIKNNGGALSILAPTGTPTTTSAVINGVSSFSDWTLAEPTAVLSGSLQFSSATYSVNEGGSSINIPVTRTGGADGAVSVSYATTDGSATSGAGNDYTAQTGTLNWTSGDATNKIINVPINNDSIYEGDENFTVTISSPMGGASLGSTSMATVTIIENDSKPSFTVDDVTMAEGNSGTTDFTFTVSKIGATAINATVNYNTADGTPNPATGGAACGGSVDYVSTSGTLTFLPAEASKTITVQVCGETDAESDETFFVNFNSPVNADMDDQGIGTITNDDTANTNPTISDIADQMVSQDNYITVPFTVGDAETTAADLTLTGSSNNQTVVPDANITFGGSGANRTVTVTPAPGQTGMATITVTVHDASNATASDSFLLTVNSITCDTPPPAMVSWYSAEGNANDIQGTNNGTEQNSPTYAAGKVGQAFQLDGTDDYIQVPSNLSLHPANLTVDGWFKLSTDVSAVPSVQLVSKALGTAQADSYGVYLQNGVLSGSICQSSAQCAAVNSGVTPVVGQWYHYAMTYDEEDGSVLFYVNGAVSGSPAVAGFSIGYDSHALLLGADSENETVTSFFPGLLDETEIFRRALTSTEVANLYNASTAGKCHTSTVQFSAATYGVGEGDGNATITVTRTGAHDSAASVDYATSDGSATGGASCGAGVDYQTATGMLNFAVGDVSKTFNVPVCDDATFEGEETANLSLSNETGTGVTIGSPNTATLIISDNEGTPSLSIDDVTFTGVDSRPSGFSGFTVTLSNPSSNTITVHYATSDNTATAGQDYTAASGTLTFNPGDTSKDIPITILADNINEPEETFFVDLDMPMGATIGDGHGIGTIPNDDAEPTVSVNDFTFTGADSRPSSVNGFTVSLSAPSSFTVTVHYATSDDTAIAGEDYTAASGTLTFDPGDTTKTVPVTILPDTTNEPDETFFIDLDTPTHATISDGHGIGTIPNDDAQPSMTINDVTKVEGDGESPSVEFTVTLSNPSSQGVTVHFTTVDGTATTAGEDYTLTTGTVGFQPNQTTQTIFVQVTGDIEDEGNETFSVVLSNPSGATIADDTGVCTIIDDDTNTGNFDGDGKDDLAVFRPSAFRPGNSPTDGTSAVWYIFNSFDNSVTEQQFGLSTDIPVAGDYDGDGSKEIAVFRPSEGAWYISHGSAQNFTRIEWGLNGDIPVPGDYDGDRKTDIAVFRPSDGYWYILKSTDNQLQAVPWGFNTDRLVPADYDGDGKIDIAVFRPSDGYWYILKSSNNQLLALQWGVATDKLVPADYDLDGKADVAVWRPSEGTFYVLRSSTGTFQSQVWGVMGDVPVVGDYDNDGKADFAVWRPATGIYSILFSSDGSYIGPQWGSPDDIPVASRYVPEQ